MRKDTKFKPGVSGNPKGRPKGARDKRTELRSLLEPHAKDLVEKVVELAKGGDTTAIRLCLERLIPPIRAQDQSITLDDMNGGLTAQGKKIILAMGNGELSPSDASTMLQALASQARLSEVDELERRVSKLEKQKQ